MKKIFFAIVISAFSVSAYAGYGLGIKTGVGGITPQTMYDGNNAYGGSVSTRDYFVGAEAFYEHNLRLDFLGNDREYEEHKIGLKFGFEQYGKNTYKVLDEKVTENTFMLPITAYYKYDQGVGKLAFTIGCGLTMIQSDFKVSENNKLDKWKGVFHIVAGTEYRISEHIGLGFDIKYITKSGVLDKIYNVNGHSYKLYFSDRSGFNGALAARYYF